VVPHHRIRSEQREHIIALNAGLQEHRYAKTVSMDLHSMQGSLVDELRRRDFTSRELNFPLFSSPATCPFSVGQDTTVEAVAVLAMGAVRNNSSKLEHLWFK